MEFKGKQRAEEYASGKNSSSVFKENTLKETDNSALHKTDVIRALPTREYNIDFNGNVMCIIKVQGGNIEIVGAINGWGNSIEKDTIIITEVGHVA